jgi:hypothetical protein
MGRQHQVESWNVCELCRCAKCGIKILENLPRSTYGLISNETRNLCVNGSRNYFMIALNKIECLCGGPPSLYGFTAKVRHILWANNQRLSAAPQCAQEAMT